MKQSLDAYDRKPSAMVNYLRYNGWHFSKNLFKWAKQTEISKEEVDKLLEKYNIKLETNTGYDYCYVASWAKHQFPKSLLNDQMLATFIKEYVDDFDQADGHVFNRFYADCCHCGIPIPWDDVL